MSSGTSHFVGTPTTGAAVPLMGWSLAVGDLRVSHFFATHAMHVVPLAVLTIAWLAPRFATRTTGVLFLAAYSALTVATFAQALAGQPIL